MALRSRRDVRRQPVSTGSEAHRTSRLLHKSGIQNMALESLFLPYRGSVLPSGLQVSAERAASAFHCSGVASNGTVTTW